jgi:hypothetical protein
MLRSMHNDSDYGHKYSFLNEPHHFVTLQKQNAACNTITFHRRLEVSYARAGRDLPNSACTFLSTAMIVAFADYIQNITEKVAPNRK